MTDYQDIYPTLSPVINMGGMKYYLLGNKPVELAYRSRADYIKDFGNSPNTEGLLRKYMYPDVISKSKLLFDSAQEKSDLIQIIKQRIVALERSNEYSSSTLKNQIFQNSHNALQNIISELKKARVRGDAISSEKVAKCEKDKQYVLNIPDDKKFQLILEMVWYLLNPDKLPADISCEWAKTIKNLDNLRLGDIVKNIQSASQTNDTAEPLSYLKRINFEKMGKKPTIKNALDEAKHMALQIQDKTAKETMEMRLQSILSILQARKYLEKNTSSLTNSDFNDLKKGLNMTLISNPISAQSIAQKGGDNSANVPLAITMTPFFNYFKLTYDPIYSILEKSITDYKKSNTISIPSLLVLLHICSNVSSDKHGIYKLTNVDKNTRNFIQSMLGYTVQHLDTIPEKSDKYKFNRMLYYLPKVHLSTLLNKYIDKAYYKSPDDIPLIQFFIPGTNLNLFKDDNAQKSSIITDKIQDELKKYFEDNNTTLYMTVSKSTNNLEDIPMKVSLIDFSKVNIGEINLPTDTLADNYFNNNETDTLDKLVKLTDYVVFNDAELALSIFIAFKDLIPK
jgi:hypothetical protein